MHLLELTTPVEKHMILHYAADGNKVVRRSYDMQYVGDALWRGMPTKNEWGETEYDLFILYPGSHFGYRFGYKMREREDITVEKALEWAEEYDTPAHFLERMDWHVDTGKFIGNLEIEFVRQFAPEHAIRYAEHRAEYVRRQEEKREEARRRQEAEDEAFVKEKNAAAEQQIADAVAAIRQGGKISNDEVVLYESRYHAHPYSLVNVLCRRYGVQAPIRTQGWIAEKLASFTVKDGRCGVFYWQKKKKSDRVSESARSVLDELIAAICKEDK